MRTKEELLDIAKDVLNECGGNKSEAIAYLAAMAEYDNEIMVGFALHGNYILEAMIQSEQNTKH